ncbi:hypothetical protein ANN_22655, partial [Periplaneta americana]
DVIKKLLDSKYIKIVSQFQHVPMLVEQKKRYKHHREACKHSYKDLYKFKKENVQWLALHFLQDSYGRKGRTLDNEMKMRIFLPYVGDPGFQMGVLEDTDIFHGTVSLFISLYSTDLMLALKLQDTKQDLNSFFVR